VILGGLVAGRCERAVARTADPAVAAYERANAAEYRGAGQAFLAAGGAVALATVGGLAGALDDRTGALLVATTATVAALGILLWGYLYRSRNPMPPRPRRHAAPVAMTGNLATDSALPTASPPMAGPVLARMDDAIAPADDGEAAATQADESDGPVPSESMALLAGPAADMTPDSADVAPGETWKQDAGSAANGLSADGAAGAKDARIVAFVGRGTRAGTEKDADFDTEDRGDERQK
jgi:hypothetical protein